MILAAHEVPRTGAETPSSRLRTAARAADLAIFAAAQATKRRYAIGARLRVCFAR